ncbi:bile acid:sodium symporter family protein [Nostoc sp. MS1]|uniref:bile acid:sodium symporter family protein n=1 Tax=Nostoc sp. MS1 TaxID=2764711 RepID=UPI001CC6E3E2|nr:bile acid:sodium symporter [Nostoc sp. MS1]BCL39069.1 transporter [Nostoc sp. MS1]
MYDILAVIDKLALFTFIVCTMLGAGLGLTLQQIWEPLRSPRLVIFSLLTNFVLVPLFVYLLLQVVHLSEPLRDGLLIMALASGPPALPKLAQIVKGNVAFSVGLMMLLMLGTIFYMPTVLPLVVEGVQINSWDIAKPLLLMMVSPLVIGLFIKAKFGAIAPIIQPILFKLSSTGLLLGLVVRLIIHTNDILSLLQTGAIFVCAVFIIFSFSIGYLLGGPAIDTQRVLGVGTAQRNFAAALLVATSNFADPSVVSIIMVTSILMMVTVLIAGPKFIEIDQPTDTQIKQVEV